MISIKIVDDQMAFRPGETISGVTSWSLPVAPQQLKLELYWTTRGKGTVVLQAVESVPIAHPPASGEQPFSQVLADCPKRL